MRGSIPWAKRLVLVQQVRRGGDLRLRVRQGDDIERKISEVVSVEQILIRNLPAGTKAALRVRALQHQRSVEAEAREIITDAVERDPVTMVDLLSSDEGADVEFEPERLRLTGRTPEL